MECWRETAWKAFRCVLLRMALVAQKVMCTGTCELPNAWSLACNARAMQLQALPLSLVPQRSLLHCLQGGRSAGGLQICKLRACSAQGQESLSEFLSAIMPHACEFSGRPSSPSHGREGDSNSDIDVVGTPTNNMCTASWCQLMVSPVYQISAQAQAAGSRAGKGNNVDEARTFPAQPEGAGSPAWLRTHSLPASPQLTQPCTISCNFHVLLSCHCLS